MGMLSDITINLGNGPWKFGWEALASIGTLLAVAVALTFGGVEISRTRRNEYKEGEKNARLLLTRLRFIEEELEDGQVSRYTPLQAINASTHPFLDVHVVQSEGVGNKFKRLDSQEWINSGEEWDMGFSKKPLTNKSWIGVFFTDTSGRSWLRPLHTTESLYEATLVNREVLPIDDDSSLPYMVLTLEPKRIKPKIISKSSRSQEVELDLPPGW